MSSAAWRLPFGGTFSPSVWHSRQRFCPLSPEVGFSNWYLLSDSCGLWHLMQSRTAGGCTAPLIVAAFMSAWQVMHSACGVEVISLIRVTPLMDRTSWQLVHPIAMAEWTN